MIIEPLTAVTTRSVRRAVFSQHWGDLTMLHWPVDPQLVAPLLPAGTSPDVHDGSSWVGLIPFQMTRVGILGTPPMPYLSQFAETNVRLYAVDGKGRRGVVFASLEASRLLPVLAAQVSYRLPYKWARMSIRHAGDEITYRTSRRWPAPRGAGGTIKVKVGQAYQADPLTSFLTARWGLFSTWYGGSTAYAPVEHPTWPVHRAELLQLCDDLVRVAGLPTPHGPPHVLWSPGVQVRIGRPRPLNQP